MRAHLSGAASRLWAAAMVSGAFLVLPPAARAAVTVLGGGLAHACSVAALAGEADAHALDVCTGAIEGEPLDAAALAGTYVNRGVVLLRRRAFEPALKDFDLAVHIAPRLGEAYVNRGAALIGQHRYADGIVDINRGLALGPEEPEKAYFNRALAYEGLDDEKRAYFDYRKAVELKPDWMAPQQELLRFTVSRPNG